MPIRKPVSTQPLELHDMEQVQALEANLMEVALGLLNARSVLFITGAGISADSGLPTYRGVGGLYNDKETEDGISIEEALSGFVLAYRPEITWKYLAQIEAHCRGVRPNAAHIAIAQLEARIPKVVVLSQNVDGLHHQAGSRDVIEIHGNLQQLECTVCDFAETIRDLCGRILPPLCPACGKVLRPKVVLFGEQLPELAVQRLRQVTDDDFDIVFSIGTSGTFPYIARPVMSASQRGIPTVEINLVKTPLSTIVDYHLPIGAAEAMQSLLLRMSMLENAKKW